MSIQELVEMLRKAVNSKTGNWRVDHATGIPYFIGSDLYESRDDWEEASIHLDKLVKGEISTPPKFAFNLHDEAVIESLTILTKEDGPTYKIINTWYYLGEKAKGKTAVLWEWYEKLPEHYKAKMLLTIMQLEGKDSKAISILREMEDKGELTKYEINDFKIHSQELSIEDTFQGVSNHVSQLTIVSKETREKVEKLYKGKVKKETLEIIERYETEINELKKNISILEKQLRKQSEQKLDNLILPYEDKELSNSDKSKLKNIFDSMLKITCKGLEKSELAKCRNKKGKVLEDFCESFFTATNGISVFDRNVNLETEEIDLFLQNNTRKPYWAYLQSPNILVECKNWTEPVGANEVKLFRQKINDHRNLIKVGFFVAINGFTDGLPFELIRSQKDEIILGIITKEDFEEFFKSTKTILEFLEDIIFKSIR